jgi:hypothetical protein
MLSVNPGLTLSRVISKIQTTARAFRRARARLYTALCGAGIIDAGAAVLSASGVRVADVDD